MDNTPPEREQALNKRELDLNKRELELKEREKSLDSRELLIMDYRKRLPDPSPRWHPEAERFRQYIDHELGDHVHNGVNGHGEEVPFVCREALDAYWTDGRIAAFLDWDHHVRRPALLYNLETFSILCYISCPAYLDYFTSAFDIRDDMLPIRKTLPYYPKASWACDPRLVKVISRFCEAQWMFKPFRIEDECHSSVTFTPRKRIMPVIYNQPALSASHDGCTAVIKASVHPCCIGPVLRSRMTSHDIVFKMVNSSGKARWENESKPTPVYS
jgi:hypothetical protein